MSFENIFDCIARKEGWHIEDDYVENSTGDIVRTKWCIRSDNREVTLVVYEHANAPLSSEEMFEKLCEAYMKKKKISSVEELLLKLAAWGF